MPIVLARDVPPRSMRQGKKFAMLGRRIENEKVALAAGVEPLPGERIGRQAPEYWAPQRNLRRAVDKARERLDYAYSAFNALK